MPQVLSNNFRKLERTIVIEKCAYRITRNLASRISTHLRQQHYRATYRKEWLENSFETIVNLLGYKEFKYVKYLCNVLNVKKGVTKSVKNLCSNIVFCDTVMQY